MIVTGAPVARFVSEALGVSIVPPFTTMGLERDGKLVAGVIFHCFEGANVHFSAAGKGWSREFLYQVGQYVYSQLGCERMTATTACPKVAAMACKLGGKVEGLMRDQFGPGKDGILVGILRDEYRHAKVAAVTRG